MLNRILSTIIALFLCVAAGAQVCVIKGNIADGKNIKKVALTRIDELGKSVEIATAKVKKGKYTLKYKLAENEPVLQYLITGIGDLDANSSHFVGILCGLGAACLYANVILLNKHIKKVEDIHRTFLQFVSAAIVLIPYVALTSGSHLAALDSKGWMYLLIVGFVHTGLTYCFYFASIKHLTGQQTAILSYIDPLVAVLLSVFVLGETMTLPQILGGALILGFTLWNEISPKKEKN